MTALSAKTITQLLSVGARVKPNDDHEKMQFYYHPDHLGSSSYITNLDGEVMQHIEYVPFGEVFIDELELTRKSAAAGKANCNNTWNTPYRFKDCANEGRGKLACTMPSAANRRVKFNAKVFDEETGMYYYGARYYEPRLSLWMSTDPSEKKYPRISTYSYCFNNPLSYIDHDGRFGKKWIANLSRKWYNLWHKQKAGPIIENKNTTNKQFRYTYNTFRYSDEGFEITSHYKFSTKVVKGMQDVGDGVALVGYAATLSVAGAEVGVPMVAAGNVVSSVGSAGEMILDVANGDYCNGLKDAAFRLFEKGTEILLNKLVPGVGKKIGEEGFNLGTEILDQGRNLKNSGLERVTDKIIEKKERRKF